jgi:hypothetical protein
MPVTIIMIIKAHPPAEPSPLLCVPFLQDLATEVISSQFIFLTSNYQLSIYQSSTCFRL